jgi:Mini-chromosome maintenance replisome factor
VDFDVSSPDIKLDERQAVYVTSIPGCTRWFDLPATLDSLSLDDRLVTGHEERVIKYGQEKGFGVVVKCYCGAESKLRVCDLVDVIGILEVPHDADDVEMVVHAITIQPRTLADLVLTKYGQLSERTTPPDIANPADTSRARDLFLRYVSTLFEGDALAGESLLLCITSTLTHRTPTAIGPLPMNIYSTTPAIIGNLTKFLREILPALAVESLSIEGLNSTRLYPKSDGDSFSAGRGQFVSRTALVIDESGLQEGQLIDMGSLGRGGLILGVRNLKFLTRLITEQKLIFEFPYYEFDIDTELSVLVLGETKTNILPVDFCQDIVDKGDGGISSSKRAISADGIDTRRYRITTTVSGVHIDTDYIHSP